MLEIGTAHGGTFFMLSQVADGCAKLATLDLDLPRPKGLVESFAHANQVVIGIEGNSSDPAVRERICTMFPTGLDLLFIDGDHSYEGVRNDFEMYRDLVRVGGMVVFHDVVPDREERTGIPGEAFAGGVPKFWREFKAENESWAIREFVESWDQDGFGIGVATRPHGGPDLD